MDTPDAGESRMEMAGGNPPADIDIYVVPDVLLTAISMKTVVSDKSMKIDTPDAVVSSMKVAGGSPPAEVNISRSPEALQTAVPVTTEMSVNINTPDTVESGREITGGSPPAVSDISVNTDVLQTARSVMTQVPNDKVPTEPHTGPVELPVLLVGNVRRCKGLAEAVHNLHKEEVAKQPSSPSGYYSHRSSMGSYCDGHT